MEPGPLTELVAQLLDETFESHHGIYTDRGTSLFETLDAVTASDASVKIGGRGPTIAAQVAHVTLYLDVLERSMRGEEIESVDWEDIWQRVSAVSPDGWHTLRAELGASYRRLRDTVDGFDSWEPEARLEVLAVIAHTAYHLGAIRQALYTL
jgi:hypothetical protein